MRTALLISTLVLFPILGACGKAPEEASAQGMTPMPPGAPHGAAGSAGGAGSAGAHAGSPTFVAQPGWTEQASTSSMRAAQFVVPDEAGNSEVVVFFFGVGGGGTIEDNFTRWEGQFSPDGPDRPVVPIKANWSNDHAEFHSLDLTGTYSGGMDATTGGAGKRMISTVIVCDGGPYFVRFVGPAASVERGLKAHKAFLEAFRP